MARPIQAALASAAAFAAGAAPPVLLAALLPTGVLTPAVMALSLALLAGLGAAAARLGGAPLGRGALRVAFWARWPWAPPRWWAACSAPWSDPPARPVA